MTRLANKAFIKIEKLLITFRPDYFVYSTIKCTRNSFGVVENVVHLGLNGCETIVKCYETYEQAKEAFTELNDELMEWSNVNPG